MYRELREAGSGTWYSREAKEEFDELESILESDFLSYLHPNVVASMKRLIARHRARCD